MRTLTREDIPLYLAGAAAATTVISIAGFEILLGCAFIALMVNKQWRWPPVTIPLLAWFALTLVSAAASGHAAAALPQIKKFYVYLLIFVVFSAFRKLREIRWLVFAWGLGAALSAAWSIKQLYDKYEWAAVRHQGFYISYVVARITGFMGHWMTFSGHMMMALLLVLALLLFSKDRRGVQWLYPAIGLIGFGLIAAYTRSMWLGAAAGTAYLLWNWKRWTILAIPVLTAILLLINPLNLRDRMVSIVQPHGETDSNEHRVVTRRIGWEMIKAHPWLGIGPEEVAHQYEQYIPADVKRPLPDGYYGHLHNIYIHYAAERGIPAMLALMWFLGKALLDFIGALRRLEKPSPHGPSSIEASSNGSSSSEASSNGAASSDEARWILRAIIAVMMAVLLSGWYELNLGDSEVLGMFLAVLGCGYVAVSEINSSRSDRKNRPVVTAVSS